MHRQEPASNELKSKDNTPSSELGLPRVFERFRLLKRIARGGMGEVYLAAAVGIEGAERPIVIKMVRRDHDTDSSFLARFLDEARIQSQLYHPGIAQILEAATDRSGKPYVAVEYVEGRNLADIRSRAAQLGVRIAWPEAVALAVTIGEALAHVHERRDADGKPLEIVHRDLSPQNVMVGYGGELKLIDFGTARGENRRCHTISGVVFAKPGYVAPEVANNTPGGVPADLYAFGVILWELLSGRRFLSGEPAEHLALVGAGKRAVPEIAATVGAPVELDRVIQKLTAHRIEERHGSARQAAGELVRILQRAPSMPDGDRSLRGRVAQLMGRLYPAEPARSRAEFQRLIGASRGLGKAPPPLPQSPSPPSSGEQVLAGTRYRIERELGRGAHGVVYEALHLDLGRSVALKVLDREYGGEPARERFVAEARAVARVTHENLVRLYELGFTSEGRPFYAMELVRGEALDKRLARTGALESREAIRVAIGACRAAGAAHAAGLVHRDIKPQNLMLADDGTVKLLDFGVAKPEHEAEARDRGEQGALSLVGTPEYMAPEQARGTADARSDVYAIGAVLYELLTGALPFDAPGVAALIERKSSSVPAPPSSLKPGAGIPKALDRIVLRALLADPEGRYQSAEALAEGLLSLVGERGRVRRRRIGAAVVATAALSAVAILGASALGASGWDAHGEALRGAFSSLAGRAPSAADTPAAPAAPQLETPPPVASETAQPVSTGEAPAPALAPEPNDDGEPALEENPEEPESALAAAADSSAESKPPPAPAGETIAEGAREAVVAFNELRARGRTLKALQVIRHAADTFPKEPAVLRAYVQAAEDTRAWGEARRVAARWVKVEPSHEARLTLARLERATGRPEKALALLEKLVEEDPSSPEVRRLLALSGGDPKLALNR